MFYPMKTIKEQYGQLLNVRFGRPISTITVGKAVIDAARLRGFDAFLVDDSLRIVYIGEHRAIQN